MEKNTIYQICGMQQNQYLREMYSIECIYWKRRSKINNLVSMLGSEENKSKLSLKQSEYRKKKKRIIAEINEITNRKPVERNQWNQNWSFQKYQYHQ